MRQQKMRVTRSSSTGAARRRFTDITNMRRQPQPQPPQEEDAEDAMCPVSPSTRIYIDTLIKENMTLMRLIGERNKLIEMSGAEMLKMRSNMQRLQLQNLNLAQSNSFMLAELNIGREKIKSLQHEIICKDAMLKAERSATMVARETLDEHLEAGAQVHRLGRGVVSSHSMSRCMTLQRGADKEIAESKRLVLNFSDLRSLNINGMLETTDRQDCSPMMSLSGCCMRSQSARFKSQRSYHRQHFFELDDPDYLAYEPTDYLTHCRAQDPSQSSSVTGASQKTSERFQSCGGVQRSIRIR
uniref:Shugoshin C-terminal domain-containing protein n=1 Tax=Kalanchoe fedtschenkoi TaxID=63787 RepID=A0A7N0REV7_KALFE